MIPFHRSPRTPFAPRTGPRLRSACAALALVAAAASAQIPEKFTNLQVLPKEIARGELVQLMRGYASALGVRCVHCHATKPDVDPMSDDLADVDFASDAREAKVRTREMIAMVRAINVEHLAGLSGGSSVSVQCATCHRGLTTPELLDDRMARLVAEQGVDAAVADYRALRDEYRDSGAYDFGQRPLNALGERLLRAGKIAEAEALLALNAELHPDADWTWTLLGEAQLKSGKRDAARASFEKVLELDPESEQARERLAELAPPPAEAPKPEG